MTDHLRFVRGNGIDVYQSYATADLGLIAYETASREGLVVDEGVIVEIVRPGTGDPVGLAAPVGGAGAGTCGDCIILTMEQSPGSLGGLCKHS